MSTRFALILIATADPACLPLLTSWDAGRCPLQIELTHYVRAADGAMIRVERMGATGFGVLASTGGSREL